jgi:hypothetical protein
MPLHQKTGRRQTSSPVIDVLRSIATSRKPNGDGMWPYVGVKPTENCVGGRRALPWQNVARWSGYLRFPRLPATSPAPGLAG